MLLLRHKAAELGGRRDTASISQSLLSLGMSYESWVATSTVQILFVTLGSTPEVLLNNKSFTNTYQSGSRLKDAVSFTLAFGGKKLHST